MNRRQQIEKIVNFVTDFPQSTASRAILRRYLINYDKYETSKELSLQLKDILKKEDEDEINFCYYLVR